jgi:stress response protein YsnF
MGTSVPLHPLHGSVRREEIVKNQEEKVAREVTIPVLEETARVDKREVETGVTKVSIKVIESEQVVEQPLRKEKVEVRHVMINRFIDAPVPVRTEGDVTIIPVIEEVLVVEKKLRLREEVHIRRCSETVTHSQKEKLRKEEAVVEQADLRH